MPKVVQFIHYGDQYVIKDQNLRQFYNYTNGNGVLYWNNGQHHRKFLRSYGDCIEFDKIEVDHLQEDLLFWGEWEPHSMFTILNNPPNILKLPYHIHRPIYCMQKVGNQNTDPLVFGDRFYYSNCQQQFPDMKHLNPGSIILFGTQFGKNKKNNANTYFVVDTVFVVKERIDYSITNKQVVIQNNPIIPQILLDCALNRLGDGNYVLYLGATKNEPKDGMFSYVPCKRASDANLQNGFERVKFYTGANHGNYADHFHLPDLHIITTNRGILVLNIPNVVDFYNRLKVKIFEQDFYLGHRFDSPSILHNV